MLEFMPWYFDLALTFLIHLVSSDPRFQVDYLNL